MNNTACTHSPSWNFWNISEIFREIFHEIFHAKKIHEIVHHYPCSQHPQLTHLDSRLLAPALHYLEYTSYISTGITGYCTVCSAMLSLFLTKSFMPIFHPVYMIARKNPKEQSFIFFSHLPFSLLYHFPHVFRLLAIFGLGRRVPKSYSGCSWCCCCCCCCYQFSINP